MLICGLLCTHYVVHIIDTYRPIVLATINMAEKLYMLDVLSAISQSYFLAPFTIIAMVYKSSDNKWFLIDTIDFMLKMRDIGIVTDICYP